LRLRGKDDRMEKTAIEVMKMGEKHLHESEMQEEYLDMLIKTAFEWKEMREELEILDESRQPLGQEEIARRDRILARIRKGGMRVRPERKPIPFPKIAYAAACLLLVVIIAAPLAIAHVGPIRTRVIRLLVDINDRYASVSLEEISPPVPPEGWKGEYYLGYLPEGFELSYTNELQMYVEYCDTYGRIIKFLECGLTEIDNVDSEDALINVVQAGGQKATIIEKDGKTRMIWANDEKRFVIVANLPIEEVMRIAESVQKINVE